MQVFRSLPELEGYIPAGKRSVATVGNFDGVHRGHRMVIHNVLERARALNARAIAITFDPHPAHVLHPANRLPLLTPTPEKLRLLATTGLDATLMLPFTEEFRHWTARQFAERVLRDSLHAIEVHEGENFRFGYEAEAGIEGLHSLGGECGFTVRAWQPLILRGGPVSSSRIRKLVSEGHLSQARGLLGRTYSILSTPASGRGYGTRYAVPTINLAPYCDLLPAHGVYITTLRIGEGQDSRTFRGVTNAGNRPTFGADSFAVETHLLNFEPTDLTEDTPLELTFLHRLRDEQRFPTPEALRAQILRDVAQTQRYFALCDRLASTTAAG